MANKYHRPLDVLGRIDERPQNENWRRVPFQQLDNALVFESQRLDSQLLHASRDHLYLLAKSAEILATNFAFHEEIRRICARRHKLNIHLTALRSSTAWLSLSSALWGLAPLQFGGATTAGAMLAYGTAGTVALPLLFRAFLDECKESIANAQDLAFQASEISWTALRQWNSVLDDWSARDYLDPVGSGMSVAAPLASFLSENHCRAVNQIGSRVHRFYPKELLTAEKRNPAQDDIRQYVLGLSVLRDYCRSDEAMVQPSDYDRLALGLHTLLCTGIASMYYERMAGLEIPDQGGSVSLPTFARELD